MIHHYIDSLAQGRSRFCLATDCATVVAAAWMAGGATPRTAIACVIGLSTWIFAARALRHYDIWRGYRGRGRLSQFRPGEVLNDLALTGVLLGAVCSVMVASQGLLGARLHLDLRPFMMVLVPVALTLRATCIAILFLRHRERERVLVVGTGALGRMTGEELRDRSMGRDLVGYLRLPNDPEARKLPAPLLGDAETLATHLQTSAISEVFIAAGATRQGAAMQQIIDVCESYGVPFALPLHDFRLNRARPLNGGAMKDGFIHFVNYQPKPLQMVLKRLFDIIASALLLWILAPLLLVVAVLVKATSPGPVLFRQRRVGMHGQEFSMLKFRSMVANAEELKSKLLAESDVSGPVFKMTRDPRVTLLGKWIRRFSIDELPQLVNVLRGDMSIVGPRPPLASEVSKYEPWQHRRLSVRPGLTCVWQVSGRNKVGFEDWMYLDMQYIDNWNLFRDFDLILKTVPAVLTGRGAS